MNMSQILRFIALYAYLNCLFVPLHCVEFSPKLGQALLNHAWSHYCSSLISRDFFIWGNSISLTQWWILELSHRSNRLIHHRVAKWRLAAMLVQSRVLVSINVGPCHPSDILWHQCKVAWVMPSRRLGLRPRSIFPTKRCWWPTDSTITVCLIIIHLKSCWVNTSSKALHTIIEDLWLLDVAGIVRMSQGRVWFLRVDDVRARSSF